MIANYESISFERKVDVLVAIHVFNLKVTIVPIGAGDNPHMLCSYLPDQGPAELVLNYSALLTSAWEVVRKFPYIYLFHSEDFKKGQWECKLVESDSLEPNEPRYYAWAETEQLAICYAALKAVGFDVKSFLKEEGKI